jgi:hypothetical protein
LFPFKGRAYQVDPYGVIPTAPITAGSNGGAFEAFAYDVRNRQVPRFFLTENDVFGALLRWTPSPANIDWNNPWPMLHGSGTSEYLLLKPSATNPDVGTFSWTTDLAAARSNAGMYYPETEGVDVTGSIMRFVCKNNKYMYALGLDNLIYRRQSTDQGLFEGQPDQLMTSLSSEPGAESLLLFTEDNGRRAGVHARNSRGELITILEGFYSPETTGLARKC